MGSNMLNIILIIALICIAVVLISKKQILDFGGSKKNESLVSRLTRLNVINVGIKEQFPDKDVNFLIEVRKLELLTTLKNIGLFFAILTLISIVSYIIYLLIFASIL